MFNPLGNPSFYCFLIVVVQSLSHIQLFATPWTAAHQASLSFTVSWSLLRFMSIEWVMLSNRLILCHPLLLLPLFIATECYGQLSSRDRKQTSGCLRTYWEKTVTKRCGEITTLILCNHFGKRFGGFL